MKVTSEQSGECQVILNIELEAPEVEKGLEKAYKRLVTKVKVPGFRPGKAPRELLERQVGQELMLQEALEDLVPDAYEEALKKENLEAVARPHIELLETSPVKLKATVLNIRATRKKRSEKTFCQNGAPTGATPPVRRAAPSFASMTYRSAALRNGASATEALCRG